VYDCTHVAEATARRLLEAGLAPWLGAIRDVQLLDDGAEFHGPLTHGGFTWNVHYVACAGDTAHEPLLGDAPVPVDELALRMFGRALDVVKVIAEEETAELLRRGAFRERMKQLRR
jgi:hypothetical protein